MLAVKVIVYGTVHRTPCHTGYFDGIQYG